MSAISWEFKRRRFVETIRAISAWTPLGENWQGLDFFPVGDLPAVEKRNVERGAEAKYIEALRAGLEAYYRDPQTRRTIEVRDPHRMREAVRERYRAFPLPS